MHVIDYSANAQRFHFVLSSDTAEVWKYTLAEGRSKTRFSFFRAEHDVHQTIAIGMGHAHLRQFSAVPTALGSITSITQH